MKTFLSILLAAIAVSFSQSAKCDAWKRHIIDASDAKEGKLGADGVRLADLNGDGRMDVVTGWEEGKVIRVCLNPGPDLAKEPWPAVTVGQVTSAEDATFADLDGDGFFDVVSSAEGKTQTVFVHWSPADKESLLDPASWQSSAFPATEKKQRWMFAHAYDWKQDGNLDLIVGSKDNGASVSLLLNPGPGKQRDTGQWTIQKLAGAGWIMSLIVRDLDGDSRPDLIYSDRKGDNTGIFVMKGNADGTLTTPPVRIGGGGEEVMFIDLADFDQDGALDVIAAIRPDRIRTYRQPAEGITPDWKEPLELAPVPAEGYGTVKAVRLADMDLDGTAEFVVTCERADGPKEGVFLLTTRSELRTVSGPVGTKFDRIELLDLDGDGDLDIMTCEERASLGVFWYENPVR